MDEEEEEGEGEGEEATAAATTPKEDPEKKRQGSARTGSKYVML